MSDPKDFPLADGEAAAKMAAATQAKPNGAATVRPPHEANEEQTALLAQIEHWKEACAEYREDAEKLRRWRRVRQRIAPDGSLRHLVLTATKSALEGVLAVRKERSPAELRSAQLLLKCEQPDLTARGKISGFSCVRGWAWPRSGVNRVEILIDNTHIGNAFHGFVRPDVIRSHPELGNDANLGFAFRLDTTRLSPGMHALKIVAVGENGQSESIEANVAVSALPQTQEMAPNGDKGEHLKSASSRHDSSTSGGPEYVEVSVVIFARNQAEFLSRSLPTIAGQKTSFKFEIIGFDTESEDGTAQIFRRHRARVVTVRRNEFHHVNTRLQSLKEARGRFVIFFVGDAMPADDHWLEALVRPLREDPLVAAAYSRQLPAQGCVPWEARDIYGGCSVVREVKQVDWSQAAEVQNYRDHQWKFVSFSDVSACYRREVLENMPVLKGLPEVEDQYWCKCLLEGGFRVVLEPMSVVIHSHNHSLRELYRRQVRFGRCFATFMDAQPEPIHGFLYGIVTDTINDLLFTAVCGANWLVKSKWMLQAPVMRFAKRYGLRQGFRVGGFGIKEAGRGDLAPDTTADIVPVERSK